MKIIVTDSGRIWNHENPYLEKYREIVFVVCLSGKKVTDKYQCFISPYEEMDNEITKYGMEDRKYQALASVAGRLNSEMHYHYDIVFLTDNNPRTLYPFYILRQLNEYNNLHLITVSPWSFDTRTRKAQYNMLLSDLSYTDSILCYDSSWVTGPQSRAGNLHDAEKKIRDELGKLMPKFLGDIHYMKYDDAPYYFDFASMNYVSLKDGFHNICLTNNNEIKDFVPRLEHATLGMVIPPVYPGTGDSLQEAIALPPSRLDGKKICNILREQRIRLAEANHIPFESEECPSIGPCAGTCVKCDTESAYLSEKMNEIPEEKRIYPDFDPEKELSI